MDDKDKIILYSGLTVALVLIGVGLYYIFAGGGMINCGTDMTCLENAAQTCTPAQGTSVSGSGGITVKSLVKILGMSGDKCKFYLEIQQAPTILGLELEGKSMTCEVPIADVKSMVSVNTTSRIGDATACSGSLIDEFEKLSASFGG